MKKNGYPDVNVKLSGLLADTMKKVLFSRLQNLMERNYTGTLWSIMFVFTIIGFRFSRTQ